jgi:hypothetical protein
MLKPFKKVEFAGVEIRIIKILMYLSHHGEIFTPHIKVITHLCLNKVLLLFSMNAFIGNPK